MPKPRGPLGKKNLIAERLRTLRASRQMSQRKLADEFQLLGLDVDKNVITRIETQKRYVTDIEILCMMKIFQISFEELIDFEKDGETGSSEDDPVS